MCIRDRYQRRVHGERKIIRMKVLAFAVLCLFLGCAFASQENALSLIEESPASDQLGPMGPGCVIALAQAFGPVKDFVESYFSNPREPKAWIMKLVGAGVSVGFVIPACAAALQLDEFEAPQRNGKFPKKGCFTPRPTIRDLLNKGRNNRRSIPPF
eukprot:TRINITY_DN9582_c0_g2_i1.p2 TRINITY_DN9582_c0_g2~~TRINITY_DN9582_c0_g2_i1.p2  ORF type:complete len:178 (-),score=67.93 TRINITY_DN9582_c0_g2_i1:86-553(-)